MKKAIILCNLCGKSHDAERETDAMCGLVADDYGPHSEEYRKVPTAESDIHLCSSCERRLYHMVNTSGGF